MVTLLSRPTSSFNLLAASTKGVCDVDPAHIAVESVGQIPGRSANAASDIHQPISDLDRKHIRKIPGCGKAAGMKVIDRGELFDGDGLR